MIELGDGLFVDPWKVAAVKRVGAGQCVVFLDGQSAIDGGFLIDKDALEAATDILEGREEYSESDDEDEEE